MLNDIFITKIYSSKITQLLLKLKFISLEHTVNLADIGDYFYQDPLIFMLQKTFKLFGFPIF